MVESDCFETSNEIRLLKELNKKSPYIIEYFDDFDFMAFFHCIITEYCTNGDLDAWICEYKIREENFTPNQIKFWCSDLTEGLVFLHEKGITHRDIKPK